MNKFLSGQCTTAPCKQVKNTCKTKLNYLIPKAEIPMSDNAHHILKFQHTPLSIAELVPNASPEYPTFINL